MRRINSTRALLFHVVSIRYVWIFFERTYSNYIQYKVKNACRSTARDRLERKIARLLRGVEDSDKGADRILDHELDVQELLTLALLPARRACAPPWCTRSHGKRISVRIQGSIAKATVKKEEEDLVAVSLPIGKGASMVIMTRREDS